MLYKQEYVDNILLKNRQFYIMHLNALQVLF